MGTRRNFNFGAVNKIFEQEEKVKNNRTEEIEEEKQNTVLYSGEKQGAAVVAGQLERMERTSAYKRAFNFKLIPREKIIFHKGNDFPMEEIEERAESILEIGLLHNLEALYDEENDRYILESGEKRVRAIDMLIKKYGGKYTGDQSSWDYKNYLKNVKQFEIEGYPVNVKYFDAGEYHLEEGTEEADELKRIDSQLRVNKANIDVLALDSVLIRKKVEENAELYSRRNHLVKREERVNVNKTIAKELHISERQVQKYKAISTLIPELQEIFDKKGMTVNEGASYAKLDITDQRRLLELLKNGNDKEEISYLYEQLNQKKKEIEEGKKILQKLEEEKRSADKVIKEEQDRIKQMETEFRAELEKEYSQKGAADKEYLEELQKKLSEANKMLKAYEHQNKELSSQWELKAAELKRKLEQKEKQVFETQTGMVRVALKLEGMIETIGSFLKQYKQALEEYYNIYTEEAGSPAPEEYEKKLEEVISGML